MGIKCGNTLEVLNRGSFLKEPVQYLVRPAAARAARRAGRALARGRSAPACRSPFPPASTRTTSADTVAAGLVPVTTCTDLLRAGGYGRLSRYLVTLEERMRAAGASDHRRVRRRARRRHRRRPPARRRRCVNARTLRAQALSDPRYHADQNRTPPRKLGTHLWLWDCLSCSKCVPACPNDAIFELDAEPFLGEVPTIAVSGDGWRETGRALYRAMKPTQIAIFADACNACGNCDVFCPEDGGPYIEKPLVFGSLAAWRTRGPAHRVCPDARGRAGRAARAIRRGRTLAHARARGTDTAEFETPRRARHRRLGRLMKSGSARRANSRAPQAVPNPESRVPSPVHVDLAHYLTLRILMDALLRPSRVHFVNAPLLEP